MDLWGLFVIIIKGLPALERLVRQFIIFYLEQEIDFAVDLLTKQDQRAAERLLNSEKAGKPSGKPGARTKGDPNA